MKTSAKYRVTPKKMVITKNWITSKFYLDWHKTSATIGQACVADISKVSSPYYKNSLFHWRSKWALLPCRHIWIRRVKFFDDPPAYLSWDRSYCCCDCCLQVRDNLGVVAIHPVLEVSTQIKIWGVQVWWMWRPLRITPADQSVREMLL